MPGVLAPNRPSRTKTADAFALKILMKKRHTLPLRIEILLESKVQPFSSKWGQTFGAKLIDSAVKINRLRTKKDN